MRIKIKQRIWHCRAGIDSGLGRQDLHVFVGVLWVRLSAENEAGSFQKSCTNLEVIHTTCFPQIFHPLFSLTGLRGVKEEGGNWQIHWQLPWLQGGVSSTCSLPSRDLHRKHGATNGVRPVQRSAAFKTRVLGKLSLFHRHSFY